ncbi:type II secretion system minor pseudopilin GspJ [Bacterioplanoides sp.]|uniref:type II secretion system minor pseudopilin GspJ n=1 Tax=Bacterioplanoides sp. TaxID=2066072 RepID=UPI003B007602
MARSLSGFTLLEVMVAIAITATLGVGASQLLRSVIDAKSATEVTSEQLISLQRFNQVVSRDLEQYINRSVRDNYGDEQASLLLDSGDYPLEFTRAGWRNSPVAQDPRSTLQRVAYRLESIDDEVCESAKARLLSWGIAEPEADCLVRYYWQVLDRASDSEPVAQVVLEQIETLDIELLVEQQSQQQGESAQAQGRDWQTSWPSTSQSSDISVPLAVRWRFELPRLGEIERIWLIAHDGEPDAGN